MVDLIRRVGAGLVILGLLLIVVWAIKPLGFFWPWVRGLPLPVRIGGGAAILGLAVLLGSLITERIKERGADEGLRDEL